MSRWSVVTLSLLGVLGVLGVGCGKNEAPPPPLQPPSAQETGPRGRKPPPAVPAQADATEGAKRTFMTVCATCHGPGGEGDGPAAASLDPRPRNYTDPAWQASVTDEEIKKIIVEGGQANGKSAMMPANPHLANQPEVLDGLVQLIRGFGKP